MLQPAKCIAIKGKAAGRLLALAALLFLCGANGAAWAAQVAGRVAQLSGPLMARKADGAMRILSLRSEFESGDTLITEKNTYALLKFIDDSEITLKPATTFKVEQFAFDTAHPDDDRAAFNLVKGGLRSITGMLGKRNKEKFSMKTSGATIGIRGTTFIAEWVAAPGPGTAPVPAPEAASRAPGLYVHVLDGLIVVSNPSGVQQFGAGQFGYVPGMSAQPVVVPANPGVNFAPPPAFNSSSAPVAGAGPSAGANAVDCEVR